MEVSFIEKYRETCLFREHSSEKGIGTVEITNIFGHDSTNNLVVYVFEEFLFFFC